LPITDLRASLITFIARRSVTTVYIVRIITPNMSWIIQPVVLTQEVFPDSMLTMPVFPATEGICIVPIRLVRAVQIMATVHSIAVTVFVALVTDRSVATCCEIIKVAAVEYQVKHLWFSLVVIRTDNVLRLFVCISTVPVCSAVVLIREKSRSIVLATYLLFWWVAVRWYGWCRCT